MFHQSASTRTHRLVPVVTPSEQYFALYPITHDGLILVLGFWRYQTFLSLPDRR